MSTRSFFVQKVNDSFQGIYCHWDGNLGHNGVILLNHYSEPNSIAELIAGGNLSILAETLEDCSFYRERGDDRENIKPTASNQFSEIVEIAEKSGCEYVYFHDGSNWQFAERSPQYFGLSDGVPFSEFQSLKEAFHDPKAKALAAHLGTRPSQVAEFGQSLFDQTMYSCNEESFLVLTDDEANAAYTKSLDCYLEEHIYPEIPEELCSYFDAEAWKRDDVLADGRSHALAIEDRWERKQENYFIYRVG